MRKELRIPGRRLARWRGHWVSVAAALAGLAICMLLAAPLAQAALQAQAPPAGGAGSAIGRTLTRAELRQLETPRHATPVAAPNPLTAALPGRVTQPAPAALPARRGMVRISGDAPIGVEPSQGLPLTPRQAAQPVTVTIVLRRTDQPGFARYMKALYRRGSPQFHRYLSQAQLAERFGPTEDTYDAVRAWLQARDLTVVQTTANHLSITVSGTLAAAARAFDTPIRSSGGAHPSYGNVAAPAVPRALAGDVTAVLGLSNRDLPAATPEGEKSFGNFSLCFGVFFGIILGPNLAYSGFAQLVADLTLPGLFEVALFTILVITLGCLVFAGVASGDDAAPHDLGLSALSHLGGIPGSATRRRRVRVSHAAHAHASPAHASPARGSHTHAAPARGSHAHASTAGAPAQKIGLLEFDTYHPSDVTDWLNLLGFDPSVADRLSEVNVNGGVSTPGAGESEVLVDVDSVLALAPTSDTSYVVYDAPASTSFVQMFQAMIADGDTVISNSWSQCEDQTPEADADAINSVLESAAASGVTAVNGSGDHGSSCLDGAADTVGVPADSPYGTAVGGATPQFGPALTYGGESYWDDSATGGGSGGYGVSRYFSSLPYQEAQSGSAMRSVPDLVDDAEPSAGIGICQADAGGCPNDLLWGGTSMAAPEVAAETADLNERIGYDVGNLNAALYPLAGTSAFHTPASMNSDFAHVGLGYPDFDEIIEALDGTTTGAVDPSQSPVLPLGDPQADGSSEGIVRVDLEDANGFPVGGKDVTLSVEGSSSAHIASPSATTDASDGAVTFTVTDTVPETITFTATDTTDGITLTSHPTLTFAPPQATGATISADPSDVDDNGTATSTVTVYLQNDEGQPASGKTVELSDNGGHATIEGSDEAVTDGSGDASFTVTDGTEESVAFTATDVSDGDLPVPGSAVVTFEPAGSTGCADTPPTPVSGYSIASWATGFQYNAQAVTNGNFTQTPCSGAGEIAFDPSGNAYVSDVTSGQIYLFAPSGGAVGPASTLPDTDFKPSFSLGGLTFGPDGELYADDVGAVSGDTPRLEQIDPASGTDVRTVIDAAGGMPACAYDLATDPLSGDVFTPFGCTGTFEPTGQITRISDPSGSSATASVYPGQAGSNGYEHPGADALTFAPDGTIYGAFNDGTIESITGTNGPSPAQVKLLTTLPNPAAGIAVAATSADGAATALYVDDTAGNINLVTLAGGSAQVSQIASGGGADLGSMAIGADGCLYVSDLDQVLRVTVPGCNGENAGPELTLGQTSGGGSAPTGATVGFTAQLSHDADAPGTPIHFLVSGANTRGALADANASGSASLAYAGVQQGIDTITAEAIIGGQTITSAPLEVHWTAGQDTSFLSLNETQQAGQSGEPATLTANLTDVTPSPAVPIAGAGVTLSLDGQTCGATTDGSGDASCSVTPTGATGLYTITAAYAGSSTDTPASATNDFELGAVGLPTSTTTTPPPSPGAGAPVNTVPPRLSGTPLPADRLSCSTGSWSNAPTSFAYAWSRDGHAIAGATSSTYSVQIADEAQTLTCTVTARNSAGSASETSAGDLVAVAGTLKCPHPKGRLAGTSVGPLSLGMTRTKARRKLRTFGVTKNDFDNFCLYAGFGIRAGYPSPSLLASVPASKRRGLKARIVLALTANPYYALAKVKPGSTLAEAKRKLKIGKAIRVGRNDWYLIAERRADGVLKVQHGEVLEVGLADRALLTTPKAKRRFLTSFDNASP